MFLHFFFFEKKNLCFYSKTKLAHIKPAYPTLNF